MLLTEGQKAGREPIFMMGDIKHYLKTVSSCCNDSGKTCNCGGFVHHQRIFDGHYYRCEECGKRTYA
jgi:hypothetical protein